MEAALGFSDLPASWKLKWPVSARMIFPTVGGHLQEGILALHEVFYGTQRLQAVQPGI
jgi:hypothetical protein